MPRELIIDFLVVSRHEEPPAAPAVSRALAAASLGVTEYTPAPPRPATTSGPTVRQRSGAFSGDIPATTSKARIAVFSYTAAVTDGMGEAPFKALTQGLDLEDVRTLREGTIALDLRITTHERDAVAVLDWSLRALRVLLDLTEGAAIDPAAQRSFGRDGLMKLASGTPLAHIAFHDEPWDVESRWLHTHGLQKFGRPELDLVAVPISLAAEGRAFLREVATSLAGGARLASGAEVDMDDLGSAVAVSVPVDQDHQAPYGRLRLADAPPPGERQGIGIARLLARMALGEAVRRAKAGEIPAGLEDIERVLAADPDDCAAMALKARLYLSVGHVMEAHAIGELMELRVPSDYRGPLTVGMALAALGRYREALHALNRSIELEPEAAEAFATRADVYARLGEAQAAATDRAHAAYLAS
jgi:hypothetical protein